MAPPSPPLAATIVAAKKGFLIGVLTRLPFALFAEISAKNRLNAQLLTRVLRYCVRSGLILGGFSALYKLLRMVFARGYPDDSATAIFLSAGLSAQALTLYSVDAYKEIFLYVLKYAVEGLINGSSPNGVTTNTFAQRLSIFLLMGTLVVLYEKNPQTLKSVVVRLLNRLWA